MVRHAWPCLFWLIAGCASARATGSFVERPAPRAMHAIAVDAAQQLGRAYPPAHTQLAFAHPSDDDFGRALATELRSLGFAVADRAARGWKLALAYVVDDVGSLYRVVLRATSAHRKIRFARAYARRGAALRPAGAWTQQVLP